MSNTQWTTPDGKTYFPAGKVEEQLPPGYYTIDQSMQGIFFERRPIKTQKLMRFPDAASDKIIEEIDKFWDIEDRFRKDDEPYKRGILLYGPPGSGKTCTLRIAVEDMIRERSGIVVDFPGPHLFKQGYEVLREIHEDLPLIVLMEDIESILQRQPESEVLNLLDGMYDVDRIVFLATTNYPERLGSRILNRPARFDKKVLIGMPSSESREIFIRSKLIDEDEETVQMWVDDTDGMSIAHINELYVANRILGDSYNEAVEVLQQMKNSPDSSTFDPHQIKREYALAEGPMEEEPGCCYRESKEKLGGFIAEDVVKTPSEIASLMTEEIEDDNGLILG